MLASKVTLEAENSDHRTEYSSQNYNHRFLFQEILDTAKADLMLTITNRERWCWSRSPLNVASHQMRLDVVRMMVKEAGIDVNSVDEVKDCQR